MTINLSVNDRFFNKDGGFDTPWNNKCFTFDEWREWILKGRAFSQAVLKESTDKKFDKSDVDHMEFFAIDIDNAKNKKEKLTLDAGYYDWDDAKADAWLHENAAFMYTSPSHTAGWNRFRIIFILETPSTNTDNFETIVKAFIARFGKCADSSGWNVDRIWFGNTNAEFFSFGKIISRNTCIAERKSYRQLQEAESEYSTYKINGDLPEEAIRDILKYIPPDVDYNTWMKAFSGVANYVKDEATAQRILEDWAGPDKQHGTLYKIRHRYERCSIGSTIYIAKQYGFNPLKLRKYNKNDNNNGLDDHYIRELFQKLEIPTNCQFYQDKKVKSTGTLKLDIIKQGILNYLQFLGYRKLWLSPELSAFVKIEGRIVSITNVERMYDDFIEQVERTFPEQISMYYTKENLLETIVSKISTLKERAFVEMIKTEDVEFIRDGKDYAYFAFTNGIVKINADDDDGKLIPYHEFDKYVWKEQIADFEINLEDARKSGDSEYCEYGRFLSNVCRRADITDPQDRSKRILDRKRYASLYSSIGYLLHNYQNPSIAKAVILCEEKIPGEDQSNGGTGKGLTYQGLEKLRKTLPLDGKTIDFRNQFVFQNLTPDTQILLIDDIEKNFNFEKLFSTMTNGFRVEEKHKKPYLIPLEESPKILITTNYVLSNDSASYRRRKHEIEYSDYYDADHQPKHDFGRHFFSDWDKDEWNRFFNFMIYATKAYLNRGLIDYLPVNLPENKLRRNTCNDFTNYAMETFEEDIVYIKQDLFENFKTEFKYNKLTMTTFSKWIGEFAKYQSWQVIEKRTKQKLSENDYRNVSVFGFVPDDLKPGELALKKKHLNLKEGMNLPF